MKILRPVHPNVGIRVAYKRKLLAMIDEMNASYLYWVRAAYRKHQPTMAQDFSWYFGLAMDDTPARELERELKKLGKRWQKNFDKMAEELAKYFATKIENRSRLALRKILRDGGFAVQPSFFKNTANVKDVMGALVAENVSLIKSIPAQFHTQIEGLVMRSVAAGRDLAPLTRDLQKQFGVTRRRAEFIARDQNNKATSQITRARYVDMGVEEAIWLHSGGGKTKRPTHVANSGKKFDIAKGWFDPDPKVRAYIQPGYLINCFPGSTQIDFAANVEKSFRHFYSGQLAKLVTDTGKTLRATLNHPILTPDGWRSMGSLDKGDYIVEVSDHAIDAVMSKYDVDRTISPTIAEIFHALARTEMVRFSEIALGNEFHGDAVSNGNIDIVFPTRALSFGGKSFDAESFKNFGLAVPYDSAFSQSSFSQFSLASFDTANSIMSCAREFLSFLWRSIGHSHKHSFAAVSNRSSDLFDPSLDSRSLMLELMRKRKNALPSIVKRAQPARIIRMERRRFSGHVFNLQTRDGYYSADGIICHNCRCVCRPVVKGFS